MGGTNSDGWHQFSSFPSEAARFRAFLVGRDYTVSLLIRVSSEYVFLCASVLVGAGGQIADPTSQGQATSPCPARSSDAALGLLIGLLPSSRVGTSAVLHLKVGFAILNVLLLNR